MDRITSSRPNTFAGLSLILDRVAERRDESMWVNEQAVSDRARYLLIDPLGQTYLRADDTALRWLDSAERERLLAEVKASFLGLHDERPTFLLAVDDEHHAAALELALGARRAGLRDVGLLLPTDEAGLFAYAKGLVHWQRETRHCPYCGSPLVLASVGRQRELADDDRDPRHRRRPPRGRSG